MLGIALLAAACIGGGLKVSNVVEIPVISTRVGGFGLALVGLIAIALGYQFHYWGIHSDQESTPAIIGSPPTIDYPSTSNALPSSAANPSPASSDPSVFYAGTVRLDFAGLDFDLAPPKRVDGSNVNYFGSGELYSSQVRIAQWDQQEQPDKAACAQHADKQGDSTVTGLTDGAIVCLRTERGHIGRFDVRSVGSDALTVYATVWKD